MSGNLNKIQFTCMYLEFNGRPMNVHIFCVYIADMVECVYGYCISNYENTCKHARLRLL